MLSQGDSERVEALHGAMSCLPRCCSPSLLHEVLSSAKMCPELRRLDMEQTPWNKTCSKITQKSPNVPNVHQMFQIHQIHQKFQFRFCSEILQVRFQNLPRLSGPSWSQSHLRTRRETSSGQHRLDCSFSRSPGAQTLASPKLLTLNTLATLLSTLQRTRQNYKYMYVCVYVYI